MKTCPKCKEEIQEGAKVCKHCNADLRSWFARHKIMTGLLVFILLGVVGSALGGNKTTNTSSTSNSEQGENKSATAQSEKKEAKLHEDVTVGTFVYNVEKVEKKDSVGGQYLNSKASGIYVLVFVDAKNNDKAPKTLDSSMFKLVDSTGREFSTSTDATSAYSISQGGKLDFFLKQMQPGLGEKGVLIFDVPKDAQGLKLALTGGFWSNDKNTINLE